jgi:hypothetical protein
MSLSARHPLHPGPGAPAPAPVQARAQGLLRRWAAGGLGAAVLAVLTLASGSAPLAGPGALLGLGVLLATPARAAESTPTWNELSKGEREVLAPLQKMWPALDASRKQKWRDIAQRFPKMPAEQQHRLQERMVAWAAMTPEQRTAARLRYEESKQLPPAERQALWEAYQALPDEQRADLAKQKAAREATRPASAAAAARDAASKAAVTAVQPKNNTVTPPPPKRERPVAPATVQATAGASTRPITQRAAPPAHQKPGQGKIAASPDLVDSATLLPQRGAASAAPAEPARRNTP